MSPTANNSSTIGLLRARGLLLVIPAVLFLVACLLADARGPYSIGANWEADYPYLLNSLNILLFHAPGHVDHPGTTVQLIGAVVVFLKWLSGCLLGDAASLQLDVLSHPEEFLQAIHVTISALIGALVFSPVGGYTVSRDLSSPRLPCNPLLSCFVRL